MSSWSWSDYLVFATSLSTRLAVEFVIVFFVLSGFSIAYSLKRSNHTLPFYKKRFIRIYPPYLLALVWAGVVFIITKNLQPDFYTSQFETPTFSRYTQMLSFFDPLTIVGNLFYLPSNGFIVQFWSLTYEVVFYALAPVMILSRKWYYRISLVLFVAYHILQASVGMESSIFSNFLGIYNFYFAMGMFLFEHYTRFSGWVVKQGKLKALTLTLFLLLTTYSINFLLQSESPWSFLPAGMMSCTLIVVFLSFKIKVRWLMMLGKHSYSLYITHFATIMLFHSVYYAVVPSSDLPYIQPFGVFLLAIPFCLGASYLFYLLIEKQTKKRLSKIRSST